MVSHVSHVSHVDVFGFNALSSTTRLLCAWWSFFHADTERLDHNEHNYHKYMNVYGSAHQQLLSTSFDNCGRPLKELLFVFKYLHRFLASVASVKPSSPNLVWLPHKRITMFENGDLEMQNIRCQSMSMSKHTCQRLKARKMDCR